MFNFFAKEVTFPNASPALNGGSTEDRTQNERLKVSCVSIYTINPKINADLLCWFCGTSTESLTTGHDLLNELSFSTDANIVT
jgi:hypothetical protein